MSPLVPWRCSQAERGELEGESLSVLRHVAGVKMELKELMIPGWRDRVRRRTLDVGKPGQVGLAAAI